MVLALQIIGATFGLIMLFITWHYYHKNTYTYRSLTAWIAIWIAFIIATLLPETLTSIIEPLQIARVLDLFVIAGMFLIITIVFYLYITVKKLQKEIEELISELAKKKHE